MHGLTVSAAPQAAGIDRYDLHQRIPTHLRQVEGWPHAVRTIEHRDRVALERVANYLDYAVELLDAQETRERGISLRYAASNDEWLAERLTLLDVCGEVILAGILDGA
eukprot:scaffold217361_cov37-Tisochrysis_lutea.AAC.5